MIHRGGQRQVLTRNSLTAGRTLLPASQATQLSCSNQVSVWAFVKGSANAASFGDAVVTTYVLDAATAVNGTSSFDPNRPAAGRSEQVFDSGSLPQGLHTLHITTVVPGKTFFNLNWIQYNNTSTTDDSNQGQDQTKDQDQDQTKDQDQSKDRDQTKDQSQSQSSGSSPTVNKDGYSNNGNSNGSNDTSNSSGSNSGMPPRRPTMVLTPKRRCHHPPHLRSLSP
ncbi:hypothetical protein C8Q80DRAFT_484103 [Daedaleopsis nitida]|nr:hypothetical protein C8Q80DRAFT_484103 [Daedaleopsis nitida]